MTVDTFQIFTDWEADYGVVAFGNSKFIYCLHFLTILAVTSSLIS